MLHEINIEELKLLQLEILSVVHEFCRLHNIRYSLAFGTLLGAVRHKGYIPWDDDIDIMMPRKDYDFFIENFQHPRYSTITYQKEHKFVIPYGKVIDNETLLIEDSSMDFPIGVNIDVFPIDICPPKSKENTWYIKKKIINNIYTVRKLHLDKRRTFLKNSIVVVTKLLTFPISLGKLCEWLQDEAIKYRNNQNTKRKGVLATGDTKRNWLISSDVFSNYKDIFFEGKKFRCVRDTESYLTATYGDYMKLPPIEKQVAHHTFKAYWK